MLQRSDIPTRELVARRPRWWLVVAAAVALVGAASLVVDFPGSVPGLARFGWGWRAVTWTGLAVASVGVAGVVEIRSREAW